MENLAAAQETIQLVSTLPPTVKQDSSARNTEDPSKMMAVPTCLKSQMPETGGFTGVLPASPLPCLDGPYLVTYIPSNTVESKLAKDFTQNLGPSGMVGTGHVNQHKPGMYSVQENQAPPESTLPPNVQKLPPPPESESKSWIKYLIILTVLGVCAFVIYIGVSIGLTIHFINKATEAVKGAHGGEHEEHTHEPPLGNRTVL